MKRYGQPQVVNRKNLIALIKSQSHPRRRSCLGRIESYSFMVLCVHWEPVDTNKNCGMNLEYIASHLPQRMRSNWGIKVYRMAPNRARLLDLAKWLDEVVIGKMMTRPIYSNIEFHSRKENWKEALFEETGILFGKKLLVFHKNTPPPVHQTETPPPSSPSVLTRSKLTKCA